MACYLFSTASLFLKALSTTAVSQERERNEKHLHKILEEERDKFTEFIKHQVIDHSTMNVHTIIVFVECEL